MSNRDKGGRFVSAEQARRNLAEQVIEENVRAAIEILRRGIYRVDGKRGVHRDNHASFVEADHRIAATLRLEHAAHAVEPLLRSAS